MMGLRFVVVTKVDCFGYRWFSEQKIALPLCVSDLAHIRHPRFVIAVLRVFSHSVADANGWCPFLATVAADSKKCVFVCEDHR